MPHNPMFYFDFTESLIKKTESLNKEIEKHSLYSWGVFNKKPQDDVKTIIAKKWWQFWK